MSLQSFLKRLMAIRVNLTGWLVAFFGIVLFRNVLESFSSPSVTGWPLDPITFLFHYPLFYLAVVLSVSLLLSWIIRLSLEIVLRLSLIGLTVLWLAPLFDLVLTGGRGWTQAYIFSGGHQLLKDFATFFGPLLTQGISPGIRIEVSVGLLLALSVGFTLTRRPWRVILSVLLLYVMIFCFFAAPSILAILSGSNGWASSRGEIVNVYKQQLDSHSIFGRQWLSGSNELSAIGIRFSVLMSEAHLVVVTALLVIIFWKLAREKMFAFWRNGRWLRLLSLIFIAGLGVEVAILSGNGIFLTFPTALSLLTLSLAVAASWLSAVCVNDLHDEAVDRIAHPDRPLIRGVLSRDDFRCAAVMTGGIGLIAAFLLGWLPFLCFVVFQGLYWVYSSPPFRLKRRFLLGNVLVAAAQFSILSAGFSLISVNFFGFLPWTIFLAFGLIFLFGTPLKDLSDTVGDRVAGIPTIPVRFGDRRGRRILMVLAVAAAIAPALLLHDAALWIAAGFAAMTIPFLLLRTPFNERPLLFLGYAYFALFAFLLPTLLR